MVGHAFFLLPLTIVMIITGIPFFYRSVEINEQSGNAGGLPQWPAKALIMIAFAMLFIQGISEMIKRIAVMRDLIPDPHASQQSSLEAEVEQIVERNRKALVVRKGSGVSHGSFPHRQHGADHVRRPGGLSAARLSGGVLARRGRPDLRA